MEKKTNIPKETVRGRWTVGRRLEPFLFLLPFFIGLTVFTIYPFVNVLLISVRENYQVLSGSSTKLGFGSYAVIFNDKSFISALKNTGLYVLFVVPASTALAVFLGCF